MSERAIEIPDFFDNMFCDLDIELTNEQKCVSLQYSDSIYTDLKRIEDLIKELKPLDAIHEIEECKKHMAWRVGNKTLRLIEEVRKEAESDD